MTATFYKCSCDERVVDKEPYLALVGTADTTLNNYSSVDATHGTLIMSTTFQEANYVKLTMMGTTKYYYITSKEADIGQKCVMHLTIDVLYTYKTDIMGLNVIVERSASTEVMQSYISDNRPLLNYSATAEFTAHPGTPDFTYGRTTPAGTQQTEIDTRSMNYILVLSGMGIRQDA